MKRIASRGFHVEGFDTNRLRDRWGLIHARSNKRIRYLEEIAAVQAA